MKMINRQVMKRLEAKWLAVGVHRQGNEPNDGIQWSGRLLWGAISGMSLLKGEL